MDAYLDKILVNSLITAGCLGLFGNACALGTMLVSKNLRNQDFIILVINRSLVDFMFCINFSCLQPFGIRNWTTNPIWCMVAGGFYQTVGLAMLLSDALLAWNRYASIYEKVNYGRIFRKRNLIIFCIFIWLFGALTNIAPVYENALGRAPAFYCHLKFQFNHILTLYVIAYPLLTVANSVIAFCYYKIYRKLKEHRDQLHNHGMVANVVEESSLLSYIKAAAVLPLIGQFPAAITVLLNMINPSIVPHQIIVGSGVIFTLYPCFLSPVLTLFLVRPVRNAFLKYLRKVFRSIKPSSQVAPGAIVININVISGNHIH